jgi:aspartyl-tRNA synthetase
MHPYRSHTCGQLRESDVGIEARLSGWVHTVRDHGGLCFLDLRDHYGITQCVAEPDSPIFKLLKGLRDESVVTVTGRVVQRSDETVNPSLPTGQVEVRVAEVEVRSDAQPLPLPVASETEYPEETRLRYRFVDLRREHLHRNIVRRSQIIQSIRRRMTDGGFLEIQTPILTRSSPEGARDFLVPSRVHPGKFYALPQAPQVFKQLLMVSGFDRYFQIAPCFRDEEARADRTPGEFYQLDVEMAFVTQDDVFAAVEPVLKGVFDEFGELPTTHLPFPRIPYAEAMLRYGSDKPDLRNPLEIADVTEVFDGSDFKVFRGAIEKGAVVRAIPGPATAPRPRSFFDRLIEFAQSLGAPGLGYVVFEEEGAKGPVAKFLGPERLAALREKTGLGPGDSVFFACAEPAEAARLAGLVRTHLGELLGLIDAERYAFCWVVDFPMYELGDDGKTVQFSHNPFSMPQGGMEALLQRDPLEILAYQYDIVCNGVELSSGAIRNHLPDVMVKAFEIAGYSRKDVEEQFGALWNAFQYGAPPHGGIAPGIDRIVMLLCQQPNLREVIAFPMTQRAEDLMMGSPSTVPEEQLRELHLRLAPGARPRDREQASE